MNLIEKFFRNTSIKQEWNPNIKMENGYPEEWLDIHFKMYPRFKQFKLSKSQDLTGLEKIIQKRKSFREYHKNFSISKEELDSILYNLNNIKNKDGDSLTSRRNYPSAGARFPIEQYIIIFNSRNYPKGIYHINVYDNTLELVSEGNYKKDIQDICNSSWIPKASCLLVLSSIPERTTIKYGNRGLRYILFEIGHIAQNFMLLAEDKNLKTCAIGGFDDEKLKKLLRCDEIKEYPLYLITLGK